MKKLTMNPQGDAPGEANPHAVESLDALGAAGARLDAAQEGADALGDGEGAAQAVREPVDPASLPGVADIVNLLEFVRDGADPLLVDLGYMRIGQLGAIWRRESLTGVAGPLVQIMERHGVALGEVMEQCGPYVALLLGVGMPTLATVRVIRENRASTVEATKADGQPKPA